MDRQDMTLLSLTRGFRILCPYLTLCSCLLYPVYIHSTGNYHTEASQQSNCTPEDFSPTYLLSHALPQYVWVLFPKPKLVNSLRLRSLPEDI